jgi:hypothetical protein
VDRLRARQTVVIVVLVIGALSIPRIVARKWAMDQQSSDLQQTVGEAFLNMFGR